MQDGVRARPLEAVAVNSRVRRDGELAALARVPERAGELRALEVPVDDVDPRGLGLGERSRVVVDADHAQSQVASAPNSADTSRIAATSTKASSGTPIARP